MSLTLDSTELVELTEKVKCTAQCRVLDSLGIPYGKRSDGSPAVLRAAVGATLGTKVAAPAARPQVKLTRR